jgi:tetratricopeptide (TPR) repeat protein
LKAEENGLAARTRATLGFAGENMVDAVRENPTSSVKPVAGTGLHASSVRQMWVLAVVLVLATIAVYYPVGSHPFANYDDDAYVTKNSAIQSGLNAETVKWAFTTYYEANWHPMTWLSHALDCQLFELNPAGHHDMNLLLHCCNVLLLFGVLWRTTGYPGRSLMVAALFALHPINVESVAWVAERKNVLSMFFFLLALGAYGWYARKPRPGRYSMVMLLYALALMAKPQVITFPCVLLLWDYWPLRRMWASDPVASSGTQDVPPGQPASMPQLLWEKVPFLALSSASAIVTMQAQFRGHAETYFPKYIRLGNAVLAFGRYIGKAFWPSPLAVLYPHPGYSLPWWQAGVSLLLLLAVTAYVAKNWRSKRYLAVGWLWFLGTLVPMIGLVQVGMQAMADRYAYLPFIGLFIMITWTVADWGESHRLPQRALAGASVVVLLALGVVTRHQLNYWDNNLGLWSHTLQVTTNNHVAEDNYGGALLDLGELEQAIPHFYRALDIWPRDSTAALNVGFYEAKHGNYATAVEYYQKALNETSAQRIKAKAYMNLGYAYRELKEYDLARDNLKMAVVLDPRNGEAWIFLGVAAQRSGDLDLAVQAYKQGMKLKPTAWACVLLSQALEQSGHPDEARAAFKKAEGMSLDFDKTQHDAAAALAH